jgi:hypothetical protein
LRSGDIQEQVGVKPAAGGSDGPGQTSGFARGFRLRQGHGAAIAARRDEPAGDPARRRKQPDLDSLFVQKLEALAGRIFLPRRPGPKLKAKQEAKRN